MPGYDCKRFAAGSIPAPDAFNFLKFKNMTINDLVKCGLKAGDKVYRFYMTPSEYVVKIIDDDGVYLKGKYGIERAITFDDGYFLTVDEAESYFISYLEGYLFKLGYILTPIPEKAIDERGNLRREV